MRRGQISVELLVALFIVAFIFVLMVVSVSERNAIRDLYKEQAGKENECKRISLTLSAIATNSKKTTVNFTAYKDFSVTGNIVDVNGTYCYFVGTAESPGSYTKGEIQAVAIDGNISLSNV
ncbi:MAG: hypothetical protein AB1467_04545 [Candidatus Diapherotrites archaeon]